VLSGATLDFVAPGWESPEWARAYYPQGLPAAWRLTYYANEFPAVLLPAARWLAAGEGTWEEWLTDTSDAFRFYLQLSPGADPARIPARVRGRLGDRLGMVAPDEGAGRAALAAVGGLPVFCHLPDSGPALRPPCLPALTPPNVAARDLRAARAWLTALHGRFGGGPVLVVLTGRTATPETLRRWWELAWLLGLA
jgi:hypothetical protein